MEVNDNNIASSDSKRYTYPSKIGLEILLPILIIFGWAIVDLILDSKWVEVLVMSVILAVIIYLLYSISYEIIERTLLVKTSFLYKKTIEIDSITKIMESNNPLSAPAASLSRLEVYYGKYGCTLISPKNKAGFVEHLKSISPEIMVKMKKRK